MTALLEPTVWRRRSPLYEAHEVTRANIIGLAEMLGGRVTWIKADLPHLHLPKSMHPARIGDYTVRELTRGDPWFPYRRDLWRDGHEPAACGNCGAIPGGV